MFFCQLNCSSLECDHVPYASYILQGSGNLDAIQIIKKLGGNLIDSYLDEGKKKLEGCGDQCMFVWGGGEGGGWWGEGAGGGGRESYSNIIKSDRRSLFLS